jgi:hypothetical protein
VKGRWDRINALDIDYLDINGSRHQHRKIVALGPQPPSAARKQDSGERTMGGGGVNERVLKDVDIVRMKISALELPTPTRVRKRDSDQRTMGVG